LIFYLARGTTETTGGLKRPQALFWAKSKKIGNGTFKVEPKRFVLNPTPEDKIIPSINASFAAFLAWK
jgi:hypothetical protein